MTMRHPRGRPPKGICSASPIELRRTPSSSPCPRGGGGGFSGADVGGGLRFVVPPFEVWSGPWDGARHVHVRCGYFPPPRGGGGGQRRYQPPGGGHSAVQSGGRTDPPSPGRPLRPLTRGSRRGACAGHRPPAVGGARAARNRRQMPPPNTKPPRHFRNARRPSRCRRGGGGARHVPQPFYCASGQWACDCLRAPPERCGRALPRRHGARLDGADRPRALGLDPHTKARDCVRRSIGRGAPQRAVDEAARRPSPLTRPRGPRGRGSAPQTWGLAVEMDGPERHLLVPLVVRLEHDGVAHAVARRALHRPRVVVPRDLAHLRGQALLLEDAQHVLRVPPDGHVGAWQGPP